MATIVSGSTGFSTKISLKRVLIFCGILSSLLYTAANIVVPMQYEGYSAFSQTVSELSAIEAPTRSLWVGFALSNNRHARESHNNQEFAEQRIRVGPQAA